MTDTSPRIRTDVSLETAPRRVVEAAARLNASVDGIEAHQCIGHGDWIYTLRDTDGQIITTVDEYGDNAGHLHSVFDQHSDPWKPNADGDEHLCELCADELRRIGGFIHARSPQNRQITLQTDHGVLTHAHYHEYDDKGNPHDHACTEAIEALVSHSDTIPWNDDWYATTEGDREITGEEMVDALEYDHPHNVPGDYQTREAFAEKVFDGDIDLPTACVWKGSKLYVPKDDVELVQTRFEEYAKQKLCI